MFIPFIFNLYLCQCCFFKEGHFLHPEQTGKREKYVHPSTSSSLATVQGGTVRGDFSGGKFHPESEVVSLDLQFLEKPFLNKDIKDINQCSPIVTSYTAVQNETTSHKGKSDVLSRKYQLIFLRRKFLSRRIMSSPCFQRDVRNEGELSVGNTRIL